MLPSGQQHSRSHQHPELRPLPLMKPMQCNATHPGVGQKTSSKWGGGNDWRDLEAGGVRRQQRLQNLRRQRTRGPRVVQRVLPLLVINDNVLCISIQQYLSRRFCVQHLWTPVKASGFFCGPPLHGALWPCGRGLLSCQHMQMFAERGHLGSSDAHSTTVLLLS